VGSDVAVVAVYCGRYVVVGVNNFWIFCLVSGIQVDIFYFCDELFKRTIIRMETTTT
jgi:hypothetical protein